MSDSESEFEMIDSGGSSPRNSEHDMVHVEPAEAMVAPVGNGAPRSHDDSLLSSLHLSDTLIDYMAVKEEERAHAVSNSPQVVSMANSPDLLAAQAPQEKPSSLSMADEAAVPEASAPAPAPAAVTVSVPEPSPEDVSPVASRGEGVPASAASPAAPIAAPAAAVPAAAAVVVTAPAAEDAPAPVSQSPAAAVAAAVVAVSDPTAEPAVAPAALPAAVPADVTVPRAPAAAAAAPVSRAARARTADMLNQLMQASLDDCLAHHREELFTLSRRRCKSLASLLCRTLPRELGAASPPRQWGRFLARYGGLCYYDMSAVPGAVASLRAKSATGVLRSALFNPPREYEGIEAFRAVLRPLRLLRDAVERVNGAPSGAPRDATAFMKLFVWDDAATAWGSTADLRCAAPEAGALKVIAAPASWQQQHPTAVAVTAASAAHVRRLVRALNQYPEHMLRRIAPVLATGKAAFSRAYGYGAMPSGMRCESPPMPLARAWLWDGPVAARVARVAVVTDFLLGLHDSAACAVAAAVAVNTLEASVADAAAHAIAAGKAKPKQPQPQPQPAPAPQRAAWNLAGSACGPVRARAMSCLPANLAPKTGAEASALLRCLWFATRAAPEEILAFSQWPPLTYLCRAAADEDTFPAKPRPLPFAQALPLTARLYTPADLQLTRQGLALHQAALFVKAAEECLYRGTLGTPNDAAKDSLIHLSCCVGTIRQAEKSRILLASSEAEAMAEARTASIASRAAAARARHASLPAAAATAPARTVGQQLATVIATDIAGAPAAAAATAPARVPTSAPASAPTSAPAPAPTPAPAPVMTPRVGSALGTLIPALRSLAALPDTLLPQLKLLKAQGLLSAVPRCALPLADLPADATVWRPLTATAYDVPEGVFVAQKIDAASSHNKTRNAAVDGRTAHAAGASGVYAQQVYGLAPLTGNYDAAKELSLNEFLVKIGKGGADAIYLVANGSVDASNSVLSACPLVGYSGPVCAALPDAAPVFRWDNAPEPGADPGSVLRFPYAFAYGPGERDPATVAARGALGSGLIPVAAIVRAPHRIRGSNAAGAAGDGIAGSPAAMLVLRGAALPPGTTCAVPKAALRPDAGAGAFADALEQVWRAHPLLPASAQAGVIAEAKAEAAEAVAVAARAAEAEAAAAACDGGVGESSSLSGLAGLGIPSGGSGGCGKVGTTVAEENEEDANAGEDVAAIVYPGHGKRARYTDARLRQLRATLPGDYIQAEPERYATSHWLPTQAAAGLLITRDVIAASRNLIKLQFIVVRRGYRSTFTINSWDQK